MVLLIGLQDLALKLGDEPAHLGIPDLVLQVRVDDQLLDDARHELVLGGCGVLAGALEVAEELAGVTHEYRQEASPGSYD